ncbi:MAG: molybdenum cofactor biosynthesis protein MoaE [Acidobacteriaceae bacterium]
MFTIGHSTLSIEIFLGALADNGVALLVDVRTIPQSRHNPQFGKEALSASLRSSGIEYRWMQSLGGLRHARKDSINTGWRNASFRGYADYMQTEAFQEALQELMELGEKTAAAIMCSEAVPWRCHRSLIGDALLVRGHSVEDIFVSPAGKSHRKAHTLTPFAWVEGTRLWYPGESEGQELHYQEKRHCHKPRSQKRDPSTSSGQALGHPDLLSTHYTLAMHVHVLLFGALKDLRARETETVELPEQATVEEFLRRFVATAPEVGKYAGSLAIAVNREYALPTQMLREGDEIALLPPVSGGSAEDESKQGGDWIRLQREPIDAGALVAAVKEGEAGAVAVFDGIVRNNTRGRRTLYLDYESYEAMALGQMQALARDARQRFGVRRIALVHRLGRLQVGETSVLIAVASAHRAQAFDACRWIIDTLKKTVPIWKKEWFEDGAVWADGEPFPAEISVRESGANSDEKKP